MAAAAPLLLTAVALVALAGRGGGVVNAAMTEMVAGMVAETVGTVARVTEGT